MHKNNGTVTQVFVLQYFLYDGIGAVVFPVQTVNVPLYTVISHVVTDFNQRIVIIPVGRPEEVHFHTGQFLYAVMGLLYLRTALLRGKLGHLFMILAVVAQVVTVREDCFHILRIFVHPFPGHKEGDLYIVLFEYGEDVAGVFIPPGRIKAQCHLFFLRIHAVNRQLFCLSCGRDGIV